MKLREFLIGTAMMSFTLVSANAITPTVPSPLITEDKILGSAYYDTLSILSTANECSDFFGGSTASVDIFNGLIGKVRWSYLQPSIGIRMSGAALSGFNQTTRTRYRLFDKVSINRNGPFYRRKNSPWELTVRGVGTFAPNTKEARVLMFLHELGHIVKGEGGNWLLPDDGGDEALSRDNTRKIEDVCGGQIRNLGKADTVMLAASGKHADEKHAVANTKP
jgi:hypothetical protein